MLLALFFTSPKNAIEVLSFFLLNVSTAQFHSPPMAFLKRLIFDALHAALDSSTHHLPSYVLAQGLQQSEQRSRLY